MDLIDMILDNERQDEAISILVSRPSEVEALVALGESRSDSSAEARNVRDSVLSVLASVLHSAERDLPIGTLERIAAHAIVGSWIDWGHTLAPDSYIDYRYVARMLRERARTEMSRRMSGGTE
jgi:hypothetical protein